MNSNNEYYTFCYSSSSSISANITPCPKITDIKLKKKKAGRKKFKETRHPVYKGVRQRNGKWVCEVRQPQTKSRLWLGTFSTPDLAARAYDVAVLRLRGESASLNFPQAVVNHELPRDTSASSLADIPQLSYSSSEGLERSSQASEEGSGVLYLDEEELFNMPGLLDSMAEGLILTPLAMKRGFNWEDHLDDAVDFSLWNMD